MSHLTGPFIGILACSDPEKDLGVKVEEVLYTNSQ